MGLCLFGFFFFLKKNPKHPGLCLKIPSYGLTIDLFASREITIICARDKSIVSEHEVCTAGLLVGIINFVML